jgi:hypothetical protein
MPQRRTEVDRRAVLLEQIGEGFVGEFLDVPHYHCRRPKIDGKRLRGRSSPVVRLTSAGIVKHLTARAGDIQESPSMSLLTASIESTGLTRWNFGLGALTLLGVFAIALALALPDSFTP